MVLFTVGREGLKSLQKKKEAAVHAQRRASILNKLLEKPCKGTFMVYMNSEISNGTTSSFRKKNCCIIFQDL